MSRADLVRAYLKAIESRGDSLAFFAEDAVQEEFPNALVPNGARRTLDELREANERGRDVLTSELIGRHWGVEATCDVDDDGAVTVSVRRRRERTPTGSRTPR